MLHENKEIGSKSVGFPMGQTFLLVTIEKNHPPYTKANIFPLQKAATNSVRSDSLIHSVHFSPQDVPLYISVGDAPAFAGGAHVCR